jgi:hypothetical protein
MIGPRFAIGREHTACRSGAWDNWRRWQLVGYVATARHRPRIDLIKEGPARLFEVMVTNTPHDFAEMAGDLAPPPASAII